MKKAIFPGSFDPFTLGHLDVLTSALKLFDKVVIGVGYNHRKQGFFTPQQRIEIINSAIEPLRRAGADIDVCSYEGLTINFCQEVGASYIIRGLRTTTDFELENAVSQANRKISSDILTIFIPASGESSFISSTVVRDLLINGGDASAFVPNNIDLNKYLPKK